MAAVLRERACTLVSYPAADNAQTFPAFPSPPLAFIPFPSGSPRAQPEPNAETPSDRELVESCSYICEWETGCNFSSIPSYLHVSSKCYIYIEG